MGQCPMINQCSTMSVFIFNIITNECTMECIQPRNEVTPQGE